MKTFKQFIMEDRSITFEELLHGPCKDFFSQSKQKGFLLRGVTRFGDPEGTVTGEGFSLPYFRKQVRKDRVPANMPLPISRIINSWFDEKFGIKARSQTAFCYGEGLRAEAESYGNTCVMLPIGKVTAIWSPKVFDLFETVKEEMFIEDQEYDEDDLSMSDIAHEYRDDNGKLDPDAVKDFMEKLNYTAGKLDSAVDSTSEIMVECDEYFLVPYKTFNELKLLKKVLVSA